MSGIISLKTDGELLRRLEEAREPSKKELREQRVSFVLGTIDSRSNVTREQVRKELELEEVQPAL